MFWVTVLSMCAWSCVPGFYVFRAANESAKGAACRSNLKQISQATLLYAEDHDGRLPPADRWGSAVPRQSSAILSCPTHGWELPGYAMSWDMSSRLVRSIPDPTSAPLVFDSDLTGPNAAGSLADLPSPPRHGGTWTFDEDPPHNNVAYADGHVAHVGRDGRRSPRR